MEKQYQEYLNWFEEKFGNFPAETYCSIKTIDELLSFRNDSLFFASLSEKKRGEVVEMLKIITFEEYKNSLL